MLLHKIVFVLGHFSAIALAVYKCTQALIPSLKCFHFWSFHPHRSLDGFAAQPRFRLAGLYPSYRKDSDCFIQWSPMTLSCPQINVIISY